MTVNNSSTFMLSTNKLIQAGEKLSSTRRERSCCFPLFRCFDGAVGAFLSLWCLFYINMGQNLSNMWFLCRAGNARLVISSLDELQNVSSKKECSWYNCPACFLTMATFAASDWLNISDPGNLWLLTTSRLPVWEERYYITRVANHLAFKKIKIYS